MAALLSSGPGGNRQTHAWKKRFTKHESIISEKIDDDKKKNVNYAKSLFNGKNYYQKKEYINDVRLI